VAEQKDLVRSALPTQNQAAMSQRVFCLTAGVIFLVIAFAHLEEAGSWRIRAMSGSGSPAPRLANQLRAISTPNSAPRPENASALSAAAAGLPVNGRTLYVRLWSLIGGAWQYADYTYTAASQAAVMISPAPGTQLGSSTVTFQWTAGTGVAAYQLSISRVPGQAEVYNQYLGSAQSATATGLPRGGVPLYVRLWSLMSGAWQLNDYVYTAAP
jgi:hypothetical protein